MTTTGKKQLWQEIRKNIKDLNDREILRKRIHDLDELVREYEEIDIEDTGDLNKPLPQSARDPETAL